MLKDNYFRRFWTLTTSVLTSALLIFVGLGCGGGSGPQSPRPTPTVVPTATPTVSPDALNLLVTDGNSLTGSRFSIYPALVLNRLGAAWMLKNFGVSGQTSGQMSDDAEIQIDTLRRAGKTDFLVAWEISNDLIQGATRDQAYERFRTYCRQRRAAGWKVIALTVLPRTGEGLKPRFEDARRSINADMRLNWRLFADALADVAAEPRLGDFGDQFDTAFYVDGTHLTAQGYNLVAGIVTARVRRLTASQSALP